MTVIMIAAPYVPRGSLNLPPAIRAIATGIVCISGFSGSQFLSVGEIFFFTPPIHKAEIINTYTFPSSLNIL